MHNGPILAGALIACMAPLAAQSGGAAAGSAVKVSGSLRSRVEI